MMKYCLILQWSFGSSVVRQGGVCCLPVEVSDGIGLGGRVDLARLIFNILFCNVLYRLAEVEAERAFGGVGSRPGSAYGLYIVRFLCVAIVQMFYLKKKALRKSEGLCVRLNRLPEVTHAYAYADICTAVEVGLRFPNQFAVVADA